MNEAASPISYEVNVARLPQRGMTVTIEADADERAALADVHGLEQVVSLRADLVINPWKKNGVRVSGRVRASVVQACIVTLEPVEGTIDEEIAALFLPEGSRLAVPKRSSEGEILLDAEGDDAPETFSGDTIDVGALVEEFFELGIDPYPRKAGAALETGPDTPDTVAGPLGEKLGALRRKL